MAYGTNAPFGLRPFSSISGGSWTEKTNEYFIYASADGTATYPIAVFTGDPVIYSATAATTITTAPTIIRYPIDTATVVNEITPVVGVFMGCEYILPNGTLVKSPYWPGGAPAATSGPAVLGGSRIKAFILDDPDVVYDIQVSTATNVLNDARFGTAPATDAYFSQNFAFGLAAGGANILNPTAGSTITGQSAIYLNLVGTTATDRVAATLPLKTIGFTPNPQNVIFAADGTTVNPFLNVRVTINNHISRVGNLGITPA
ncbi:hypothetical protein UFOVP51_74 [uncultured Caudovirales phage]|uniref:Uncharacterized protein n=1 Tax=uncultured Caudovirales phage TaxID=2100421 RepID=A0A6J5KVI4_9CAUD|nr:hypothetical protein UFOVP51_74 [uncultured Caudovirales phage]CAB4240854.1 hypothetical protein UFOVP34_32 [uncultured Caudovirales phage]